MVFWSTKMSVNSEHVALKDLVIAFPSDHSHPDLLMVSGLFGEGLEQESEFLHMEVLQGFFQGDLDSSCQEAVILILKTQVKFLAPRFWTFPVIWITYSFNRLLIFFTPRDVIINQPLTKSLKVKTFWLPFCPVSYWSHFTPPVCDN